MPTKKKPKEKVSDALEVYKARLLLDALACQALGATSPLTTRMRVGHSEVTMTISWDSNPQPTTLWIEKHILPPDDKGQHWQVTKEKPAPKESKARPTSRRA